MELKKKCFKCGLEKPLSEFYKHHGMIDGHIGKCKICAIKDSKDRTDILSKNSDWIEKERKRCREKSRKYEYSNPYTPKVARRWRDKFPEKRKASTSSKSIPITKGNHRHHWNYNIEYWKDIIELSVKQHMKAHRFLIYDQERRMYRRNDNNELLDTKERYLEWVMWCIENKED